jgi:hypothetical protein
MSDKDREAFEADYSKRYLGAVAVRDGASYKLQKAQHDWCIWQAARNHYAPKLSENDAVEKLQAYLLDTSGGHLVKSQKGDRLWSTSHLVNMSGLVRTLRAAGMRFKEEA